MLIYLSLIEEDAEREKFEILYDAYRNLMFYLATRFWVTRRIPRTSCTSLF